MATVPALLSLDDYLNTSYSPDREYLDGLIVERNEGQGEHSYTQGKIYRKLDEAGDKANFIALPEQRTRVRLDEFESRMFPSLESSSALRPNHPFFASKSYLPTTGGRG